MTGYKITREEPEGPLRTSLKALSDKFGDTPAGDIFSLAYTLANEGLDVVKRLEEQHNIGDSNRSIPTTYHTVKLERGRGTFADKTKESTEPVLGM